MSHNEFDVSSSTPKNKSTKYVRAVITGGANQFLAQVNNRVALGSLTVTIPGCAVAEGDSEVTTLAKAIRDNVGITMQLDASNCRFLINRTYEFNDSYGKTETASINFYEVVSDGAVPRNMDTDNVLSVAWMSLGDLQRYLDLGTGNWKVMLGALDAVEAALDPARSKRVDGGREVARRDGGAGPEAGGVSQVSRLPYTA